MPSSTTTDGTNSSTVSFPNPLDQFQSHSVHFVLLAARTTQDVIGFTDPAKAGSTLAAIDNAIALGAPVKYGNSESVYLMIDTRRFSQFQIDEFELDTRMTGFSVPGSNSPSSTATSMKFTVIDSMGISFANFLQYLMDQKLQVSFDGMTLLLRVLFIGHTADGTTEVVQSITIPAIFNTIQVDLNEVKGLYHCTLFPLIGMVSNSQYNPKWTNIGTASSYFTGLKTNTLGALIDSFEAKLNSLSADRYTQLNATTSVGAKQVATARFGRPVQYMITLPAGWDTFTFAGPAQHGATETNFQDLVASAEKTKAQADAKKKSQTTAQAQKTSQKNSTAPTQDSYLAVAPELSITEVLDIILGQCPDVAKLGNFTHKAGANGDVTFYKHLITITSDDNSFTVHVDIVEFLVPNADLATSSKAIASNQDDIYVTNKDGSRSPRQFVEFDYIFSGKNKDVLHLDLKIENLNILLMQGVKLGQGAILEGADQGQKQADGSGTAEDTKPVFGLRSKDPVMIPRRTSNERSNFSNYGPTSSTDGDATPQAINQQYVQNLSAFYGINSVSTKMQIRGNPDIMAHVALQALPEHVSAVTIAADGTVSKTNTDVKTEYRKAFETDLLKLNGSTGVAGQPVSSQQLTGRNYVSCPFFVKVNVYGPNVDFTTNEQQPGGYTQKLFYNNYYFADTVTSTISGGKFTQDISVKAFSIFDFPNTVAKGATASTVKDK